MENLQASSQHDRSVARSLNHDAMVNVETRPIVLAATSMDCRIRCTVDSISSSIPLFSPRGAFGALRFAKVDRRWFDLHSPPQSLREKPSDLARRIEVFGAFAYIRTDRAVPRMTAENYPLHNTRRIPTGCRDPEYELLVNELTY